MAFVLHVKCRYGYLIKWIEISKIVKHQNKKKNKKLVEKLKNWKIKKWKINKENKEMMESFWSETRDDEFC